MRAGKASSVGLAVLMVASGIAMAQTDGAAGRRKLEFDKPKPVVLTKAFPARGALDLDVNVGDVRVARNPQPGEIRIEIQPRHFNEEREVRSWVRQFDVAGDRAAIRVHLPKEKRDNGQNSVDAEVVVYVPGETALKLDLGVGDMRVSHIRGDKTLHVGIGDLRVGVEDSADYLRVENSVKIGDVSDAVFHESHSGFFAHENRQTGSGFYHLRASVGIGDLKLEKEEKL